MKFPESAYGGSSNNLQDLTLLLRRSALPRGGPICPEAGLNVPRRAYPSPRRARTSRDAISPEAGLGRARVIQSRPASGFRVEGLH